MRLLTMRHFLGVTLLSALAASNASAESSDAPRVLFTTNHGDILVELYPEAAPQTVENVLSYVDDGFYAGTVFHRVIPGFMIQGGGFDADLRKKSTRAPVQNEADNGLLNDRGTLAMARTNDPHSATAQFFVNLVDNSYLNFQSKTTRGWGYTVFGRVLEGMEVVDAIAGVKTTTRAGMRDVPAETVVIETATRVGAAAEAADDGGSGDAS
ncbi:MAG: peptidylprolyl isomerase [Acidobacteriota bacterium]